MSNFRYTFGIARLDDFIYVVGGREFGNDMVSIISKCERFDLVNKVWEDIAPLC